MTPDELKKIRARATSLQWTGPSKTLEEAREAHIPITSGSSTDDIPRLLAALDEATALAQELRDMGRWAIGWVPNMHYINDHATEEHRQSGRKLLERRLPWEAPQSSCPQESDN